MTYDEHERRCDLLMDIGIAMTPVLGLLFGLVLVSIAFNVLHELPVLQPTVIKASLCFAFLAGFNEALIARSRWHLREMRRLYRRGD